MRVVAWIVVAVAMATLPACSFRVDGRSGDGGERDLGGDVGLDLASPGTLDLAGVDLAQPPPGTLMLTHNGIPASVDLTDLQPADWAHWWLTPDTPDHKAGVSPPLISASADVGANSSKHYVPGFSWRDGTPLDHDSDNHYGIYVNGGSHGFTVSAPADGAGTHTLRLYVAYKGTGARLEATLSGAVPITISDDNAATGNGAVYVLYIAYFRAGAPGQHLTVNWHVVDGGDAGSSVSLLAATYD